MHGNYTCRKANALKDFSHLTLEHVMVYASWLSDNNQPLAVCVPADMKMN